MMAEQAFSLPPAYSPALAVSSERGGITSDSDGAIIQAGRSLHAPFKDFAESPLFLQSQELETPASGFARRVGEMAQILP
jgi:hypothetical protein